jgi:hypothetical protein
MDAIGAARGSKNLGCMKNAAIAGKGGVIAGKLTWRADVYFSRRYQIAPRLSDSKSLSITTTAEIFKINTKSVPHT